MDCPKCTAAMESVAFEDIVVDRCTSCKGIWFDLMEHERLAGRSGSERIDSGDARVGRHFDAVERIDCPRCQTRMIRMVDARQPHIRYEACKVCYGVFLDAGEFKDLSEHTLLDTIRNIIPDERS
jgi:Zn-finger nucleic acid-binding protein